MQNNTEHDDEVHSFFEKYRMILRDDLLCFYSEAKGKYVESEKEVHPVYGAVQSIGFV